MFRIFVCRYAEIPKEEKNNISHRSKAFAEMINYFKSIDNQVEKKVKPNEQIYIISSLKSLIIKYQIVNLVSLNEIYDIVDVNCNYSC